MGWGIRHVDLVGIFFIGGVGVVALGGELPLHPPSR